MKKISLTLLFILTVSFCGGVYAWPLSPLFPPPEPQTRQVPIIMYHLISKNPKNLGPYGISPDEMESDLKYLAENGYEPVLMIDLIRFVEDRDDLPEKSIVLTFDDGRYSDYDYLLPLLEKYDMKAVLSVVGEFTDENTEWEYSGTKPHLTWAQIEELYGSKRVEIQNHSYHSHDGLGCGRRRGEPMEAYQARLRKDLSKLQETLEQKIGRKPTTFTYPLGKISDGSDEVLKELGFKASLSCGEGVNVLVQGEPDGLFRLKRNIRRNGQPVSSILKKLEKKN